MNKQTILESFGYVIKHKRNGKVELSDPLDNEDGMHLICDSVDEIFDEMYGYLEDDLIEAGYIN